MTDAVGAANSTTKITFFSFEWFKDLIKIAWDSIYNATLQFFSFVRFEAFEFIIYRFKFIFQNGVLPKTPLDLSKIEFKEENISKLFYLLDPMVIVFVFSIFLILYKICNWYFGFDFYITVNKYCPHLKDYIDYYIRMSSIFLITMFFIPLFTSRYLFEPRYYYNIVFFRLGKYLADSLSFLLSYRIFYPLIKLLELFGIIKNDGNDVLTSNSGLKLIITDQNVIYADFLQKIFLIFSICMIIYIIYEYSCCKLTFTEYSFKYNFYLINSAFIYFTLYTEYAKKQFGYNIYQVFDKPMLNKVAIYVYFFIFLNIVNLCFNFIYYLVAHLIFKNKYRYKYVKPQPSLIKKQEKRWKKALRRILEYLFFEGNNSDFL